jgi:two-component sensor histidine kinase
LQEAYQVFETQKMYKFQIKATNKIAQVLADKQDYQAALKYHYKTLELSLKYKNDEYSVYSYTSIGQMEGDRNHQYRFALENFSKAKKLLKGLKDMDDIYYGVTLSEAEVFRNLKQYDKAIRLLESAIDFYHKNNVDQGYSEAVGLYKLGGVYYLKKDFTEAEKVAKNGLILAEKLYQSLELQVSLTDLLRQIYEAQHNIQAAYTFSQKWRVLNDTLTNQTNRNVFASLQIKFETTQKESQIKKLDEQNHLQQKQLIGAIIGLLTLYQKLKQNKLKVEEQSNQLTTLMKELHHRVKNNLAIISSLLSMQSNRLEDKNAANAVREGQMRVQAMSLIHQRLYNTDDVSSVNIKDYFTELAESLMQAYGYSSDNFDLIIEVDKTAMDVDLAIPMGLIVNELLTNSFKYAYEGIKYPSLTIILKNGKNVTLQVQDNGIGIDELVLKSKTGSFGQKLIKGLSKQLNGQYRLENQNGTFFELKISKIAA